MSIWGKLNYKNRANKETLWGLTDLYFGGASLPPGNRLYNTSWFALISQYCYKMQHHKYKGMGNLVIPSVLNVVRDMRLDTFWDNDDFQDFYYDAVDFLYECNNIIVNERHKSLANGWQGVGVQYNFYGNEILYSELFQMPFYGNIVIQTDDSRVANITDDYLSYADNSHDLNALPRLISMKLVDRNADVKKVAETMQNAGRVPWFRNYRVSR